MSQKERKALSISLRHIMNLVNANKLPRKNFTKFLMRHKLLSRVELYKFYIKKLIRNKSNCIH